MRQALLVTVALKSRVEEYSLPTRRSYITNAKVFASDGFYTHVSCAQVFKPSDTSLTIFCIARW